MRRLILYAVLLIQVLGLAGLYAWNAYRLTGPGYLLECAPIDPRDLLRGDYITLSYKISQLPQAIPDDKTLPEQVYVVLKQNGQFWETDRVTAEPPSEGAVYLRARREGRRLYFGLEKYFVREGHGNPRGKLTAKVAIRDGEGRIQTLYVDGHPWK